MDALEWPVVHPCDDGSRTENLRSFRIPSVCKAAIQRQLATCGTTHSRLFPDLDGLSAEINRSRRRAS